MKDEGEHVPNALGGVVGGGVAVPDRRQRLRHHIHRDAVGLQLAGGAAQGRRRMLAPALSCYEGIDLVGLHAQDLAQPPAARQYMVVRDTSDTPASRHIDHR